MAAILWRGASLLDGAPIVVLATEFSRNEKTGNMVQTYILREDVHPLDAIKSGEDSSICGDCKFRGDKGKGRICYVRVENGPTQVWSSFHRGKRLEVESLAAFGRDRLIRIGAYGDPAAVPYEVWECLVSKAAGWTGYTHQWTKCDPRMRGLVHASVDSLEEGYSAREEGWKTYRVVREIADRVSWEFTCPAQATHNAVTCASCLRCDGSGRSTVAQVHGVAFKVQAFQQLGVGR